MTIFTLNIADNFLTPLLAEINIDLAWIHARDQKPLKQQPPAQQVKICDRQSPSNHRANPEPRPGPTAILFSFGQRISPKRSENSGKPHQR